MRVSLNFACLCLAVPALVQGSQLRGASSIGDRHLGCNVDMWTNFDVYLPTNLTVYKSEWNQGSWCMNGCQSSSPTSCGPMFDTTTAINCPLNNIYVSNNGQGHPCEGAHGTIYMQPDPEYTDLTGLQYITYSYQNSGGPNAADTNYQLTFYTAGDTGYIFGEEYPISKSGSHNNDGVLTFKIETVATPAPKPNAPNFTSYDGLWVEVTEDVTQYTISSTITYQGEQTNEYSQQFQEGLSLTDNVKFTDGLTTATMSEEGKFDMTETTDSTLTIMGSESTTYECSAVSCPSGRLYQWVVAGNTDSGDVSTLSNCIFTCIPDANPNPPLCPNAYCGDVECQCCNSVWMKNNTDPVANNLCPATASPTPSP